MAGHIRLAIDHWPASTPPDLAADSPDDPEGLSAHRFRSSFRDWAAEETGDPREVIKAALAHVVPNKVEAAYARSGQFERRRLLMDDWATYLVEQADGSWRRWRDGAASDDRPNTDRIDEDGGGAEVVGDEPVHCRERQSGAAGSKGVEGAEPHARSQCGTLRGLAHDTYRP